MAITTPPQTLISKETTQLIKSFKTWAAGRTGFTQEELLDIWATSYKLRPEEIEALKKQLKLEIPKPPTPTPKPTPAPAPKPAPTVPPETIITRIAYPKWWKDGGVAKISLTAPGSQTVKEAPAKGKLYIPTIVITVTGATAITISFGGAGASGPIHLGDTNQPMGIVIAMGNSPAPCGTGGLSISATDPNAETPSIGGFATYYIEET